MSHNSNPDPSCSSGLEQFELTPSTCGTCLVHQEAPQVQRAAVVRVLVVLCCSPGIAAVVVLCCRTGIVPAVSGADRGLPAYGTVRVTGRGMVSNTSCIAANGKRTAATRSIGL